MHDDRSAHPRHRESISERQLCTGARGNHRARPGGHRNRSPLSRRPLSADRPEPDRRPGSRDATTGSSATAWRTDCGYATARRTGTATGGCGQRMFRAARRDLAGRPANGGFDFAANTNVIGHAGKTLAIAETGARPYELTDELETVGPSDFCGTLFGGYTAHPKRDPVTGELHAVSYNPMRGNIVQYTVTGVDGKVRRTVDIRLKAQTMMHDFSLTEKYVVLYDLPVALDFGGRAQQARESGRRPADPRRRTPRRTGLRAATRDAQIRAGRAPPGWHALPVGARASGPRRCDAPRGHRRRHPVVRGAAVLRLPSAQRLRRGSDERIVLDVVRHSSVFDTGTPGARNAVAGPVDGRSGRRAKSARSASTTPRRSSRASTSDSSAGATATGTRSATPRGRRGSPRRTRS